jgi:predicted TIM-barrel fold metal-dependent hydrolase
MVDHIMFSSDYPHWDFDDPARAFPAAMPKEMRDKIMGENACRLYGLTPDRPAAARR